MDRQAVLELLVHQFDDGDTTRAVLSCCLVLRILQHSFLLAKLLEFFPPALVVLRLVCPLQARFVPAGHTLHGLGVLVWVFDCRTLWWGSLIGP